MASEAAAIKTPRQGWPLPIALALFLFAGISGFLIGRPAADSASNQSAEASAASTRLKAETAVSSSSISDRRSFPSARGNQDWNERWRAAQGRPNNPARIRELAALIEELARHDHNRALALAGAQKDWRVQDILRDAALRGWASVAPDGAGDYALTLPPSDRRAAVAAVFQGAANQPGETVRLALRLCNADPGPAGDYGHSAIAALAEVGAFTDAVNFGQEIGAEKYPFLLKSAFFQWARNQPAEALAACDQLQDPKLRAQAREEVVSGWAWADPKGLSQQALKLSSTDDRKQRLDAALPLWMEREPDVAIEWINSNNSGPEFDAGVAAAANLQSFIVNQPSTAMDLATRVSDPALRKHTMRAVFRQWALADLEAARTYAESRENSADRAVLEGEMEDLVQ